MSADRPIPPRFPRRPLALAAGAALALALGAALVIAQRAGPGSTPGAQDALVGEAHQGALTVKLGEAVADVPVTEARLPGRPIVLIDPGHGGTDPGAISASGQRQEKALTLAMAQELRDRLAAGGRVRVALTRQGDETRDLAARAALARRLSAQLMVAIHMDSAPNPQAQGATAYSLSEVASDGEAAKLAHASNAALAPVTSAGDADVRSLLTDLAFRDQMAQSAALANRIVARAKGRPDVLLRPEPHRFADFHVLRRSETPAVLFEAGYISNAADEARLADPARRRPIVEALAEAIEAEAALIVAPRSGQAGSGR